MNTNPDETKLALWLDDELTGAELAEMDAWAATQPDQLAARDELRKFRGMLAEGIPASEEPPFPDFFLTRIHQGIRESEPLSASPAKTGRTGFWKSWLMPMAACAGMILAFSIGKQTGTKEKTIILLEDSQPMAPLVYTPEEGVVAELVPGSDDRASVILLKGVTAIPDSTDFTQTVYVPSRKEGGSLSRHERDYAQLDIQ